MTVPADFLDIAYAQPELLRGLLAKSSGAIGELLVGDALTARGYTVRHLNNNARQRDLVATAPDGTTIAIEVKTGMAKRPTWWCHRPDPARSPIWVFVAAPRAADALPDPEGVEMFVLTAQEAAALWAARAKNLECEANGKSGDLRYSEMPSGSRDAWHKLQIARS